MRPSSVTAGDVEDLAFGRESPRDVAGGAHGKDRAARGEDDVAVRERGGARVGVCARLELPPDLSRLRDGEEASCVAADVDGSVVGDRRRAIDATAERHAPDPRSAAIQREQRSAERRHVERGLIRRRDDLRFDRTVRGRPPRDLHLSRDAPVGSMRMAHILVNHTSRAPRDAGRVIERRGWRRGQRLLCEARTEAGGEAAPVATPET